MAPPVLQEYLQYLLLQPPSCILLSQEQEEVGLPAPLLSLLSPFLACLLAQTQDPSPCLSLPCPASTVRRLLDYLTRGQEQEIGKEVEELAEMLGVTHLIANKNKHANLEKDTAKAQQSATLDEKGDGKTHDELLFATGNPCTSLSTEKQLEKLIQTELRIKALKQTRKIPTTNVELITSDLRSPDNYFENIREDNSIKEHMRPFLEHKFESIEIEQDMSTINLENEESALEEHNIFSNICVESIIIPENQVPDYITNDALGKSILKDIQHTCDKCGDILCSKRSLKQHRLSKHDSEGNKYNCDHCKYYSVLKGSLDKHIDTHHNNVRYPCHQCDYKATQKGSLKLHKQNKHDGKQFICDVCGNTFSLRQTKHRHMENMHGRRRSSHKKYKRNNLVHRE